MSTPFTAQQLLDFLGVVDPADYLPVKRHLTPSLPCFMIRELDSNRKGALAKSLAHLFDGLSAIVSVHLHGVWPSGEIVDLFHRLRRSQGLSLTLYDCPGELVSAEEADYLVCLIACCLFNCWDFSVLGTDRAVAMYATHDDELFLESADPARHAEVMEAISWFGLTPVLLD